MKKLSILLAISLLLFSCGNRNAKSAQEGAVLLSDGAAYAEVNDSLSGLSDSKTYRVQASEGQNLSVTLAATTQAAQPANVRIKQLISPSGVADGPFGLQLNKVLTEAGVWTIIIDESNMVGETYRGSFTLGISVK